jgi:hypothetical protein
MVSKTILFVAIGIIAGIVIGLASYPVTTAEKAKGSPMDNQNMQSIMMDSMSGNQSMMSDDPPLIKQMLL